MSIDPKNGKTQKLQINKKPLSSGGEPQTVRKERKVTNKWNSDKVRSLKIWDIWTNNPQKTQ